MKHSSTPYVGLDVHKESIAVAYVSDAKDAEVLYLGSIRHGRAAVKCHVHPSQFVAMNAPPSAAAPIQNDF